MSWGLDNQYLSPYNSNLVAAYRLEEATGAARNDSIGSNNLSDNGSVAQITGEHNYGAYVRAATNAFLSKSDPSDLELTGSICCSFWIKIISVPGDYGSLS